MALVEYFQGGESPTTGTNPGKLRAVMQYLSGFAPGIYSDIFQWNDPMPGIMEHSELVSAAWRSMRNRLARPFKTVLHQPPV
jgi:predicted ATP-grasp superfamily ATP-dependent carboligase